MVFGRIIELVFAGSALTVSLSPLQLEYDGRTKKKSTGGAVLIASNVHGAACPVYPLSLYLFLSHVSPHSGIKLPTVLLCRTSNCILYYSLTCLELEPRIYNVKTINYHISTYFKFIVWSLVGCVLVCRIWTIISLFLFNECEEKRGAGAVVEDEFAARILPLVPLLWRVESDMLI